MAVVTGKQAGFTGGHNVIAHHIATGTAEGENKEETGVSVLLGALAESTSGCPLSNRCFAI